jgi:hypothetical protein
VPEIQRLLARNWNLAAAGWLFTASSVANSFAVSTPLRLVAASVMSPPQDDLVHATITDRTGSGDR